MFRKVAKGFVWLIGGVVALVVLVYGVALAVNRRDEAPSAAARRFTELYAGRPNVADGDNAFVYLMGMQASREVDPFEVGLRRVDALRARGDWNDDRASQQARVPPLAAQTFASACTADESQCATVFGGATALIEEWTRAEPELLPRYRALLEYHAWRDEFPGDVSLPLPPYSVAMDGQRLWLLLAHSSAERGEVAEVQSLLASDARFWRNVLASTDMLITKMIATAALKRHFVWGNLVLRRLAGHTAAAAAPSEWRAPLADSERSMVRTMAAEWLYVSSMLVTEVDRRASSGPWSDRAEAYMLAPLFQPQDTINRFAEDYWAQSQALDAPLANYPAALDGVTALAARQSTSNGFAHWFYNPLGKVLFATAADFRSYAARVADIEGVRRAALAAVTLRAAATAASEVEAALRTGDWRSPYGDSVLEWNATDQVIVFRGLEPGERGEHRVVY